VLFADGANGEADTDRFTRHVLHAAAESAKRDVVRRLAAGREAKRARDPRAYIGGRPPFGYQAHNGALRPHPDHAPTVRRVFDLSRRGRSVRAIATEVGLHPTAIARMLAYEGYKLGPPADRIVDPKVFNAAARAVGSRRRGRLATQRPHRRGRA
jgi:DNA invertase Pin-like site-specific DNA recombinase